MVGLSVTGCEAIAGYNRVQPWPPEAATQPEDGGRAAPDGGGAGGSGSRGGAGGTGARASGGRASGRDSGAGGASGAGVDAGGDGEAPAGTGGRRVDAGDAGVFVPDSSADGAPAREAGEDAPSGPCPVLVGNDACATVPRFTASTQVVDGIGDEFCDVPAMVFDVSECPTLLRVTVADPAEMPERATLRIAWSSDAFHLHIHVADPQVIVNPDPARLWDGDAVELFIAGPSAGGLTGSYNGSNDGGAIQIVLAPPGAGFPTRGQAFFNPGGNVHTNAPISSSIYAGRLVDDGYELELRLPWVAFADPAIPGALMGFDVAISTQKDADVGRQLQCIISDVEVDGTEACDFPRNRPAEPYCDDRTWCRPELQP